MTGKEAMTQLRNQVKKSKLTYRDIAQRSGNSPAWIGQVLRGNYPGYKAYKLPKNIRVVLEKAGFDVPEVLHTY